jgi:nitrogen fixation protein NifX
MTPAATVVRSLRLLDPAGAGAGPQLRVAVASQHGSRVDAHFGFARRLMVFDVTPRTHRLVQVVLCPPDETDADRADDEDRIGSKVAALAGCHVLFALAIGPPAAARVIGANIHPIKVDEAESIPFLIARVQSMMRRRPPPWLRRILVENQRGRQRGRRERSIEVDGQP